MPTLVGTAQLTINDLKDGLTARLSNESFVIAANTDGYVSNYSNCNTTMSILIGSNDDTANWSYSIGATSSISGNLVGSSYYVSNLSADTGYVDITASKFGYTPITKRFVVSKARQGNFSDAILLSATAPGFFYRDGVPNPANQKIGLTVIRANGNSENATFTTSNGKTLSTNLNEVSPLNYSLGLTGMQIFEDTAYVDISDFDGEQQLTITARCGGKTASYTLVKLEATSAQAGATRNVFRGNWTSGDVYQEGDSVIYMSNGWVATQQHTASGLNTPPSAANGSSLYWTLYAVKGDNGDPGAPGANGNDAIYSALSNEAHVFPASSDGTVSSYTNSGTLIYLYEGTNALTYDGVGTSNGTWKVTATPTNIATGTLTDSGTFLTVGTHSTFPAGNDTADISYLITGKTTAGAAISLTRTQTFTKAKAGVSTVQAILSNESHTIPTDNAGNNGNYTGCATTVSIYVGATDDSANWSATFTPGSGVTGSPSGKTYTVTGLSVDSSYVDVVCSRSGFSNLTKRFTLAKAKAGTIGVNGADGTSGTDGALGAAITLDSTGQVFTYTDAAANPGSQTLTFTAATPGLAPRRNNLTYTETFAAPFSYGASLANFYTVTDSTAVLHPDKSSTAVKRFVAAASTAVLFLRYSATFAANTNRTLSIYLYVPTQAGVTNFRLVADYADVESGTGTTISTFDQWVRVSANVTLGGTARGFVDFNIQVNGGTPATGFTFYACCAQEEAGQLTGYQKVAGSTYGTVNWSTTPAVTLGGSGLTRTLAIADFGTNREVKVKVDLDGGPSDHITVVRLERSTAAAGATVGATIGTNLSGQITPANASTFIAAAAITNALIGDVIQSNSYVANTSGWKIDKTGNIELNSAVFRGTIDVKSAASGARLVIKSNVIGVYDAGGVLRVKLGDLSASV